VIIASHGGPDGRERATRTNPLPAERLRLAHSEHMGRTSAIFGSDAIAHVRVGLGIGAARGCGSRKPGQTSPIKFSRSNRALRNPSGSTRIEALQKSSHVRCPFTHVQSFPDALS